MNPQRVKQLTEQDLELWLIHEDKALLTSFVEKFAENKGTDDQTSSLSNIAQLIAGHKLWQEYADPDQINIHMGKKKTLK